MNIGAVISSHSGIDAGAFCSRIESQGWRMIDACEGRNANKIILLYQRGKALAGIIRTKTGFDFVEVIR
jgi:hypothetical protein